MQAFVILVARQWVGQTTTIGSSPQGSRAKAARHAGGGRHLSGCRHRAVENLGRAYRKPSLRAQGADAAGLVYEALAAARTQAIDVLIVDTATPAEQGRADGRMQKSSAS